MEVIVLRTIRSIDVVRTEPVDYSVGAILMVTILGNG